VTVKLALSAAALVCAALAFVAGPALSTERWRPDPVDFELRAPGGGASAAGAGPVRSRPLETPKRFNLVGLRWRGSAEPEVRVRVRRPNGRWSRWQALTAHAEHNPDRGRGERRVAASDPLWVGEADAVQYRLSRRVPGMRLHFVNVNGSASAGDRLLTAVRGAVNSATTAAAGLLSAGDAVAQDPRPDIVSRAEWGASKCPPRTGASYGTVKAAYVHHTVSLNDYSADEAPAIVLAVCRYHRNSNGWDDIGYNALVDKYGVLYEGRAGGLTRAVIGAQAQGFNAQSTSVSNIGDFSNEPQTPEALAAMARFIRWKLPLHGVSLSGTTVLTSSGGATSRYGAGRKVRVPVVLGHRDTNSTACPGTALYEQLPELREMVETGAPVAGLGTTRVTAAVDDDRLDYGDELAVSGTLLSPEGAPLAAQPVTLQGMSDGRWRALRQLVTGSDGFYATELKPRKRMYLRARFPTHAGLRGASSTRVLVRLRAVVTLRRTLTSTRRGRRVVVKGTVAPRKRAVALVLQQRVRGRWKRVGVRATRVRKGRFRTSFVPAFRARYRFYVVAKADDDTDRGRSELRELLSR
jgi:hypothetical protein